MRKTKIILIVLMLVPLVMSCHLRQSTTSGALPLPKLRHGWSPIRQMELNGKPESVQCMTIEDKQKLTSFILMYEAQAGAVK